MRKKNSLALAFLLALTLIIEAGARQGFPRLQGPDLVLGVGPRDSFRAGLSMDL